MSGGRRLIADTVNVIEGDYALAVGEAEMAAPPGWRWLKLAEIARLESGHTPSRQHAEYWDGDIPWIGLPDAREHHGARIRETSQRVTQAGIDNSAARLLPKDTVCLSRTASIGYATVMDRPMATSQDFVNWVCGPDIDPDFLMHLFLAEKDALRRFSKGSTHSTIYFPEVQAFRVCAPSRDEQRRIVAKLDALRARSRRAKDALDAVPALLDRLRQSILAAAFRGDLTADWREQHPDVEPASELLKRIRVERRRRWEEAERAKMMAKGRPPKDDRWKERYVEPQPPDEDNLPELPQTWCWATFETVGEVDLGRQRAPQYAHGVGVRPYLRVANIKDDRIDFDDVNEMDFDGAEFEHYSLRSGDILLSEGQSPHRVGQSAIYRGEVEGLCFQKTLHRFRRYDASPSAEYFQLLFRHYVRAGVFRAVASLTTNIAHLTLVRLKPLAVPLPPLPEAEQIARRASAMLARVEALATIGSGAANALDDLDRDVLASAFRGELLDRRSDRPAARGPMQ